jgi:uncharacterized protein (DUF885 family)
MQDKSDAAVEALSSSHFDIPAPIRRLECRIAPTHEGGIYYTGPSEDFSRPGRMWWSVPQDVTWFGTWRETTTVYHEGVPGHHLQVGQTVFRSQLLNRWRRLGCWVSGHGEGWALYAERLMADLGFLDDPADRFGMLDAQAMRAARVALDIGVHLGLPAPSELGGGTWDADKAWTFLTSHVNMAEGFLRFELDRYLGWPGQAPAYKVGERGDGSVRRLLHPRLQRSGVGQRVRAGLVEVLDRLLDRRARLDAVRCRGHLGSDPRELLLPPGIRLVEIDGRTEVLTQVQLVELAAARVGLAALR